MNATLLERIYTLSTEISEETDPDIIAKKDKVHAAMVAAYRARIADELREGVK